MPILRLFFSFDGRISRKSYLLSIAVVTLGMFALMHAVTAIATADPLASALWSFRREDIGIWGPVYVGVVVVALWPGLALLTKRLHDRSYPMWVALALYLGILIATAALFGFGLVKPGMADPGELSSGSVVIATLVMWPISIWFAAQSMFMRGVVGPNAYGPDPLAGRPLPGYEPRTFWNVVFNPDGRMNRKTWWLMFVSLVVLFVIWGATYGAFLHSAISSLPQSPDPAWADSVEGREAIARAVLPGVVPLSLVLYLLLWPTFAAGTKRLHDRGRSGWVLASYYVPFALLMIAASMLPADREAPPEGPGLWLMIASGVIFAGLSLWLFVELAFLKGEAGANAYGPGARSDTQTA